VAAGVPLGDLLGRRERHPDLLRCDPPSPSVLQRWEHATRQRITDMANTNGDRRDAVAHILSLHRMMTRRSKT
jgi:hypothetical protein